MFDSLGKLIEFVDAYYKEVNVQWNQQFSGKVVNLKKKLVFDIRKDMDIFDMIMEYRSFVNQATIDFLLQLSDMNLEAATVTSRVKAQNSIEFKIDSYIKDHQSGKIPIKKCLNDLFGVRIVLDKVFSYDDVELYVSKTFPLYKCINSSKQDYIATHIYFEEGNFSFPWELQVWAKENEKRNYASHKEYKQDYTRWEKENKGGKSI